MPPAIQISSLSKRYQLGGPRQAYQTLRESMVSAGAKAWDRAGKLFRPGATRGESTRADGRSCEFWALREISLDVQPGEVVGVIGQNGAGKSTLLKILSRITEPTHGRALVRGRVGSLLEVGTGFHPELTGRENIFLNGAILGMSRHEIRRRFDEIVAFAELERFLDTPVKRYSSGMYVRLAFAVAANLEPEILIVDEVLAVGDASFQKKCLGKMKDVRRQGRTVLFVSHNLAALETLCQRGIVLDGGQVLADAPAAAAISTYLRFLERRAAVPLEARTDRTGVGAVRLLSFDMDDGSGARGAPLQPGNPFRVRLVLTGLVSGLICVVHVLDKHGHGVLKFNSDYAGIGDVTRDDQKPELHCVGDQLLLAPGRYRVDVAVYAANQVQDRIEAAAFFDVARGTVGGREVPRSMGDWKAVVPHRWQVPSSLR